MQSCNQECWSACVVEHLGFAFPLCICLTENVCQQPLTSSHTNIYIFLQHIGHLNIQLNSIPTKHKYFFEFLFPHKAFLRKLEYNNLFVHLNIIFLVYCVFFNNFNKYGSQSMSAPFPSTTSRYCSGSDCCSSYCTRMRNAVISFN